MNFNRGDAEIFVPDCAEISSALARTTHMCVAAHPDDAEVMALDGILACFGRSDRWFLAVIMTDGAGSPRTGRYAAYSDRQMRVVRRREQQKASLVGEYSGVVFLNHPSNTVKDPANDAPRRDLSVVLEYCHPQVIYTHNLADKHDTHVSVALRTIEVLRRLPREARPQRLLGCEVWRSLDWLVDRDKVIFTHDKHENIANALLCIFDSQIEGGKRYDRAVVGRRHANATFLESHLVDTSQSVTFGMDLTPLIYDDRLTPLDYVQDLIRRFANDVSNRLARLS